MFTGLIEEVGTVISAVKTNGGMQLHIKANKILRDVALGDSISVNGACLTVSAFEKERFTADIMPETLMVTRFGEITPGTSVHLERALRVGDRLGGHFVTGHIDAVGTLVSSKREGDAIRLRIQHGQNVSGQFVYKGSVAIDGVSLTVADLGQDWIEVSLVGHTQKETRLAHLTCGDSVHIESDMLLKYVYQLTGRSEAYGGSKRVSTTNISMETLSLNGFL